MTNIERVKFFEEDCKAVVGKFRATLFNYDNEKNDDFRAFAINTATNSNKILSALHCGAVSMVESDEIKIYSELLDILTKAFARIDEDMKHANSYIDYVNYLESKQN